MTISKNTVADRECDRTLVIFTLDASLRYQKWSPRCAQRFIDQKLKHITDVNEHADAIFAYVYTQWFDYNRGRIKHHTYDSIDIATHTLTSWEGDENQFIYRESDLLCPTIATSSFFDCVSSDSDDTF